MKEVEKKGLKVLLKYPDFFKLWFGRLISRMGDSLDSIAFMWMIYQLTESPVLMGTIMAVNFLPNLLFGMFAGVFVDRWNKKWVMISADIGRGVGVAIISLLYLTGHIQPIYLYIITFFNSTLETFAASARTAIVPRIVTDESDFLAANSLFRASSSLAELFGLGLAGVIIGIWGIAVAIILDSLSFFLCSIFIALLNIAGNNQEAKKDFNFSDFKTEFKEGLYYSFQKPLVRFSIILGLCINLFVSPFNVLAPIYAEKTLLAGVNGFSLLSVGITLGMLIGSLLIGQYGKNFSFKILLVTGLFFMATGFTGFYFTSSLYLAVIAAFVLGFGVSDLSSTVSSMVMTYTPNEVMGRVSSVMNSLMMAAMPLSTSLTGVIVKKYSVKNVLLFIGLFLFILFIITNFNKNISSTEEKQIATT